MPTQEERIAALEQTTSEYRPVLHNFAYELSMVKGLIVTQTDITQQLGRDTNDIKKRLETIDTRLDRVEMMLNTILERLHKNP
jgi:hypothetical protein